MAPPPVKTATRAERDRSIAAVVLGFSADPVARWSYPEPYDYIRYFTEVVRAFGGAAFEHDSADYVGNFSGAALWLPPNVQPEEQQMMALLQQTIAGHKRDDVMSLLEQMASFHPSEPHWYLPLIGVDPARQGEGLGSALMAHAAMRCDRENRLAYLEATSTRSVPLYERHGFEVVGTIRVGSSPPVFPMVRHPR